MTSIGLVGRFADSELKRRSLTPIARTGILAGNS